MDRREFCRKASLVGGSVVLAPLVNACSTEKELASESATAASPTAPKLTAAASRVSEPTAAAPSGVVDNVRLLP